VERKVREITKTSRSVFQVKVLERGLAKRVSETKVIEGKKVHNVLCLVSDHITEQRKSRPQLQAHE
jgi:hypothetical protein